MTRKFEIVFYLIGDTNTQKDHKYGEFSSYSDAIKYLYTSDDPYLTWSKEFKIEKVYRRVENEGKIK